MAKTAYVTLCGLLLVAVATLGVARRNAVGIARTQAQVDALADDVATAKQGAHQLLIEWGRGDLLRVFIAWHDEGRVTHHVPARDYWGVLLRARRIDERHFEFVSAGPDGHYATDDDVRSRQITVEPFGGTKQ